MRKSFVLVLILIMTTTLANSQDILGKWYAISESHLIELVIDEDFIKVQVLHSRDSNIGFERDEKRLYGIHDMGDKKIAVVGDNGGASEQLYYPMVIFNIQKKSSLEIATKSKIDPSKTINELIDAIAKDSTELLGNVFYHEEKIKELENLKDLDSMPLIDFRLYFKNFIEQRNKFAYLEDHLADAFHDHIVNRILIELGYNPLFRNDWENRFLEKYILDEEIQKIYEKKY